MSTLVLKAIGTVHSPFRNAAGTPIQADIKPYAPRFDCFAASQTGWLQNKGGQTVLADSRFERKGKARRERKTGVS